MPLFGLFASVCIESVLQRDLNLLETVELHREIQNVVDRDSTSSGIKNGIFGSSGFSVVCSDDQP